MILHQRILSYSFTLLFTLLIVSANEVRHDEAPPPAFRVHPNRNIPLIHAKLACEELKTDIPRQLAHHRDEPLTITNAISMLYEEGDNPSTTNLFNSIPEDILQPAENIKAAIASVGEWNTSDVIADFGYGEQDDVQKVDGGLPSFCRFGASITTSEMSAVWFETWLPLPGNHTHHGEDNTSSTLSQPTATSSKSRSWRGEDKSRGGRASTQNWRGRLVFVGNAGQSGGVNYPEMKQVLTRYREAAASTNGGHFGSASLSNWTIGNPESQLDFGNRGVHVASVASQVIVKAFYGVKDRKTEHGHKRIGFNTYFKGCSTGGRQAFAEAQKYVKDYDGILAGSPALFYNDLNAYQIHVNSLQSNSSSPRFIPTSLYPVIHRHIIDECDLNDGVKDAVIQDPSRCNPKLHKLLCPTTSSEPSNVTSNPLEKIVGNATSQTLDEVAALVGSLTNNTSNDPEAECLTQPQLDNLYDIYKPLRYPDGTIIHEPVLHGSEFSWTVTDGVVGKPFPPAPGWFQYQVLNLTSSVNSFNPFTIVEGNFSLIEEGNRLNPGQTNTQDPNLTHFFARGSKLIHYHGLADQLIPSGASDRYHKRVRKSTFTKGPLSDHYRYFHIPGMAHCRGGDGAWNFGGASQTATAGSRPLKYNAHHDALLALFKWREHETAPKFIVGAAYKTQPDEEPFHIGSSNDTTPFSQGVKFSHKMCPYPQQAVLVNPDHPYKSSSLHCEHVKK